MQALQFNVSILMTGKVTNDDDILQLRDAIAEAIKAHGENCGLDLGDTVPFSCDVTPQFLETETLTVKFD